MWLRSARLATGHVLLPGPQARLCVPLAQRFRQRDLSLNERCHRRFRSTNSKSSKNSGAQPLHDPRNDTRPTQQGQNGEPKVGDAKTDPASAVHDSSFAASPLTDIHTPPHQAPPAEDSGVVAASSSADTGAFGEHTLPDLTQGIPSTLDAELDQRRKQNLSNHSDLTAPVPLSDKKGEKDTSHGEYISSLERKRARIARWLYGILLFNLTGSVLWLGRNWANAEEAEAHPDCPSGWGPVLFYNRLRARLRGMLNYYKDPAFQKLLPAPTPEMARPYTLVVSLEDLLVHSEWTREHGWRMAKRPGVDYFLRYLSQYYELVIWTSVSSMIAQPIIMKLDPYRVVMWPLFREATRYEDGVYIKDLECLNRDPKKVLVLDTDPSHTKLQPDNAVILPKWTGKPDDKGLVSLIPFLEYCATMNFEDLREVRKSFPRNGDLVEEFARREAIARENFKAQLGERRAKRPARSLGFVKSLTGGPQSQLVGPDGAPMPTLSDCLEKGQMYQDLVRERGQKTYELLEKAIREDGDKWLQEMAAEEKKMNDEALNGMKSSITGYIPFLKSAPSSANDAKDTPAAK